MRQTRHKFFAAAAWLPAAFWYHIIWSFSAQTGDASSDLSDQLLWRLLMALAPSFGMADSQTQNAAVELLSFFERKSAHVLAYLMLTLLIWFALSLILERKAIKAAAATLLCVLLAGLDEYHQTLVPGRSGEPRDVLVDLTGAVLAILFLTLLALAAHGQRARRPRPWALAPMGLCALLTALAAAVSPERLASLPALAQGAKQFIPAFFALPAEGRAGMLTALAPILREMLFLTACALLGFGAVLTAAMAGVRCLPALGVSLLFSALWVCLLSWIGGFGFWGMPVALAFFGCLLAFLIWLCCLLRIRLRLKRQGRQLSERCEGLFP